MFANLIYVFELAGTSGVLCVAHCEQNGSHNNLKIGFAHGTKCDARTDLRADESRFFMMAELACLSFWKRLCSCRRLNSRFEWVIQN